MIRLQGVEVDFTSSVERVTALEDVDFEVRPGELVVLHGTSGSGKSTLLSVISGLQRVTKGSVTVGDVAVTEASERVLAALRLEQVGIVFQDNNLISEFTALENVELPLRARGLKRLRSLEEAESALHVVGLRDMAHRRPAQLSGGQKQRVGIARAIAGGKRYLLADEPTGSLDTTTSLQILQLMRGLANEGLMVIVASHDPRAFQWADRTVELVDGKVAAADAVVQSTAPVNA